MTSVAAYPAFMTVEEFETYPFPEGKVELVRGEPMVGPLAGASHGGVQSNLMLLLVPHVHAHGLGRVFTDGLSYELVALPRTVRMPDASFVRAERLPTGGLEPGFLKIAPDFAVEVLSPSDKAWELEEKLADYRAAGTPLIWVIDDRRRSVMIVSHDAPVRWLGEGDTLEGGDIIPGFRCPVSALFAGIAPLQKRRSRG